MRAAKESAQTDEEKEYIDLLLDCEEYRKENIERNKELYAQVVSFVKGDMTLEEWDSAVDADKNKYPHIYDDDYYDNTYAKPIREFLAAHPDFNERLKKMDLCDKYFGK